MNSNKILAATFFSLNFFIFIRQLVAAPSIKNNVMDCSTPCHICLRIVDFAATILPSCPQPVMLDQVLESICEQGSLSDISEECDHFVGKVILSEENGKNKLLLLENRECLGDTRTLCGPTHLSCCHFLSE